MEKKFTGIVNDSYTLVKMQEREDNAIKIYWHLVEGAGIGSYEYTVCGKAFTDSKLDNEDFEFIEEKKGGKITCPLCTRQIKWFKSIN